MVVLELLELEVAEVEVHLLLEHLVLLVLLVEQELHLLLQALQLHTLVAVVEEQGVEHQEQVVLEVAVQEVILKLLQLLELSI
jgi:hypothetical protein